MAGVHCDWVLLWVLCMSGEAWEGASLRTVLTYWQDLFNTTCSQYSNKLLFVHTRLLI